MLDCIIRRLSVGVEATAKLSQSGLAEEKEKLNECAAVSFFVSAETGPHHHEKATK